MERPCSRKERGGGKGVRALCLKLSGGGKESGRCEAYTLGR